jgi:hypothetical protein
MCADAKKFCPFGEWRGVEEQPYFSPIAAGSSAAHDQGKMT